MLIFLPISRNKLYITILIVSIPTNVKKRFWMSYLEWLLVCQRSLENHRRTPGGRPADARPTPGRRPADAGRQVCGTNRASVKEEKNPSASQSGNSVYSSFLINSTHLEHFGHQLKPSATSHHQVIISWQPPLTSHQPQATSQKSSATVHQLSASSHQPSVTSY